MSPSSRVSLLLLVVLASIPAHARRRDRQKIEEETQRGPAASASDIPALDDLLRRAGWEPTPELSGAFKAGGIFTETTLGHQIALDDCFETAPTESTYTATEIVTNLQAGVSIKVGAGSFGASGGLVKKIKFSTPVHAAIPTLKLNPSETCKAALIEAGQAGRLALAKTYVVKEVLTAQIAEQTCGRVDAHGAFAILGQADAELSMACAQHSLEPVAVAYRTTPVGELLRVGESGEGGLEVGGSSGSGDFVDKLAQLELARQQREVLEAQQAEIQRKERELLARLEAERSEKLDAAEREVVRDAASMWARIAPIVEAGGPEAKQAVELFVGEYGSAEVWVEDQTGRYERAVRSPEVAKAQAWLGSYRGDTGPVGGVEIDWVAIPGRDFELSRSEVTFGQYQACVDAGVCTAPSVEDGKCRVKLGGQWKDGRLPSSFQGVGQPVVCVDWHQATTFADWAGGRLPTEAEWEYAAKGGQGFEYAGSADVNEVAWYSENSSGRTHDVCGKKENGYGLCDMSGNVWEWTSTSEGSNRVFRGGSWDYSARYVRVAHRGWNVPGYRYSDIGFRLAR